ncbi:MAG TPA: 4,5-DOPA dioxygenase extradiol [Fusibacter sp.]|nr:4,5-DOPA dioxygenase extradiol [Fusibacter sp.]
MKMPVIFVGHGSPMNAIENNAFTAEWESLGKRLPRPKAILCVSAHWYTDQTKTADTLEPRMIYDMYGFPQALYELKYPVKGSVELSNQIVDRLGDLVTIDNRWGIDHGTWSVLCKMYPEADIPVVQVSVNSNAPAQTHFDIGRKLADLRNEGILIMGSGNIVHNLSLINWSMAGGYTWAQEFDDYVKMNILNRSYDDVVHYERAGKCAEQAFYTPDHFYPLLYVLGAADKTERIEVFNDKCLMGSMSMTGYLFGL